MKQTFSVTITTDGMDGPKDMEGIAEAIQNQIADIVRPFVREIAPSEVVWERYPVTSRDAVDVLNQIVKAIPAIRASVSPGALRVVRRARRVLASLK